MGGKYTTARSNTVKVEENVYFGEKIVNEA